MPFSFMLFKKKKFFFLAREKRRPFKRHKRKGVAVFKKNMPTRYAKERSLIRKREDEEKKVAYKKEFLELAARKNNTVVHYEDGTFSRQIAHKVQCSCGVTRLTSLFEYRRNKGGCLHCRPDFLSRLNINRHLESLKEETSLKEKREEQTCLSQRMVPRTASRARNLKRKTHDTIHNKESLTLFLKQNNNKYNNFILHKIMLKDEFHMKEPTQKHHIIPLHSKGPNVDWNIIYLSVKDHAWAHALLYEVYKKHEDLKCLSFFYIHLNKEDFDINKVESLFSGVSSVSVRHLRTSTSLTASHVLRKGTVWKHPHLKENLLIGPNQMDSPSSLKERLVGALPNTSPSKAYIEGVSKTTFRLRVATLFKGRDASMYGFTWAFLE